ncbi:MAG: BlaI/MecI/CopY family transcriptional regulator [Clostridia bacterium]|nr:BlaI/MecI/CopY family transcriptional regulator [Clostridia bacterium]MBR0028133.1 BlaI/MecI/CopY family transcriptional regulator [Clostridia bacterium]
MKMKIKKIPETELEIMQVIWSNETPITTTEIKKQLEEKRPWSQGALQSLLTRLVDREFLKASMQGKSKAFEPLVNEKDYIAVESRSFISKLRGRSTITDLVTTLYDTNEISNKDIEELDAFIEKIKKEGK